MRFIFAFLLSGVCCFGQTNSYLVDLEDAAHHEAMITATFPEVESDTLILRMSRTSPGRYALHEFGKNVYGVEARDSKGNALEVFRPDPYSWAVTDHDGTVNFKYILFGNRGDGTYTQIDRTHAHLNIPATFIYAEDLKERPVKVTFDMAEYPQWKVATQLRQLAPETYLAPDLYYFMDSPIEVSDFDVREFSIDGQKIRFVLHHPGTPTQLDIYFEKVKDIVIHQKEVFGELPEFDYGQYTFLADYMPNVAGDGMEHRNSTVLTSPVSLGEGGMKENIGTVSHEFFHSWNVERIRPATLEPFDFTEANMSGELWFAEGFTSYYTDLILARAGIISPENYVKGLSGSFNYVWNSPARKYFSPVEMSYQAPFVDAATSVDPVNRENTFISYYSYGSMLGLALDLKLRQIGLNLDDFMQLMWKKYGVTEIPYTLEDLEQTLSQYAGPEFASDFFGSYVYNSEMPDYDSLFATVGVRMRRNPDAVYFGASVKTEKDVTRIASNPLEGGPAYIAGLDKGDRIISINNVPLKKTKSFEEELDKYAPGETVLIKVGRYGTFIEKEVKLQADPAYLIELDPSASPEAVRARENWLSGE